MIAIVCLAMISIIVSYSFYGMYGRIFCGLDLSPNYFYGYGNLEKMEI
jgi:hypothetical protein